MTNPIGPGSTTAVSRYVQAALPRAIVIESPLPGSPSRDTAKPSRRQAPGPVSRVDGGDGAQTQRNKAARARLQKPETGAFESGPPRSGAATTRRDGAAGGELRGSVADESRASALRLASIGFTTQLLAQSESDASQPHADATGSLLERGHVAYRRAGGEPPLFSDDATLFSLTA